MFSLTADAGEPFLPGYPAAVTVVISVADVMQKPHDASISRAAD